MQGECKSCGNNTVLQNKKGQCGDCVFKKNHGGKSRQEVYTERVENKKDLIVTSRFRTLKEQESLENNKSVRSYHQDEESAKNERNQNQVEENEKIDQISIVTEKEYRQYIERFEEIFHVKRGHKDHRESLILSGKLSEYERENFIIKKPTFGKLPPFENKTRVCNPKKQKSIKKVSAKQSVIERAYHITIADMDYTTELVCTGCLRYQGGDIKLSHSHIISRADCKAIGREDLVSERDNLTYHCLDFGENTGCHRKWENPRERITLDDYEKNLAYIKTIDEGLYLRYIDKS